MVMLVLLAALQTAQAPPRDPRLYVVGPNDVLSITVFNQPQLSGKFTIEADGTFAYPLLGRVAAGGSSIRAVEDKIRAGLAAGFLENPQVSVSVDQFRSQQIFVMGEVKNPGPLQFTGAMTLIEALSRAGSTTEHSGHELIIVHSSDGTAAANPSNPGADAVHVDLDRLQRGLLTENIALRAGDTVFVPRAETLFVSGQVKSPGEYALRSGMTVRQAVALAGGVTERGSMRRVQVIRTVDGKSVTLDVDLQERVQAGDTIVVRERFF
jgi:polysaccharide export outer membrane protein